MASDSGLYRVYLGEFHWAPAYRYEMRNERRRGWIRGEHPRLPGSVLPTAESYLRENGTFDCSIDDSVSLKLPSRWLAEEMGVAWNGADGRWFTGVGQLAFEDPTAREVGPSALIVDRAILTRFLRETGHTVVWTLGGERRVLYPTGESHGIRPLDVTGFYWFDGTTVHGAVRAADRSDRSLDY